MSFTVGMLTVPAPVNGVNEMFTCKFVFFNFLVMDFFPFFSAFSAIVNKLTPTVKILRNHNVILIGLTPPEEDCLFDLIRF